ncbi:hypothetical protein WMF39_45325 [Sorangium sp. So ce1504]|uniref:hypothetical protein n=1 Tax=Sorangium sp. So ce1504 TaxID=3133337 RepID=UPI003F607CAD
MKLHRGILTAAQRKALDLLGPPATSRGLYLGGGTALALRLGHRSSIDFDWFSDAQLDQQRFQTADVGHVLVALSYFDDAERTRMPRMNWDIDWKTIRRSVEGSIRDAARRL